ncbi:hypothetical protein V2J09_010164 [Rumex salicifolius]
MGVSEKGGSDYGGNGVNFGRCLKSFVRRKQVDSENTNEAIGNHQLAKALSIPHVIAIGVGSTIGAGVYILVGTVARELTGPALTFSFLIAGIAAGLSAFCYAELASRCPSAGSAYHYSYICVGESVAWVIGWGLILEYTISGSAVARGISPNLASLFGGQNSLPFFLARQHIPVLDIVVDPCAAVLVLIVTWLLCVGIKESTMVQSIVTSANVCAMVFVILAGGYLGFKTGWAGYELSTGYFPYGVDGMLAGSATVFFAYIGFDSVASLAEEVKNPQRDLPLGIASSLSICCALYMLVSVVIVGLVPYYALDPDTPISSAFSSHGMQWAAYIITVGTVTALCSTLMGSLLPQPRILMAMARDGLLPPFFSDVHKQSQVPVKSTVATGLLAALLALFMDVSQLAGMVSVGTLLAFTMVAISVLILRYVPPNEAPISSSLQGSIDAVALRYNADTSEFETSKDVKEPFLFKRDSSMQFLQMLKQVVDGSYILNDVKRRKIAGWAIMFTCVGVLILTSAASCLRLTSVLRYTLSGAGGALLIAGLIVLTCIDQDDARHTFGHTGGILVYLFYGRRHSSLKDAVYVPNVHVDEIYCNPQDILA